MQLFLTLLGWILMGLATAYFAQKRGRDPIFWFVIGLLLGVFGVILVLLLPNLNEKKEEEVKTNGELFVHPPEQLDPVHETQWWFLDQEGYEKGPVNYSKIVDMLEEQNLTKDTYVWSEGMQDWQQIKNLPEFNF